MTKNALGQPKKFEDAELKALLQERSQTLKELSIQLFVCSFILLTKATAAQFVIRLRRDVYRLRSYLEGCLGCFARSTA